MHTLKKSLPAKFIFDLGPQRASAYGIAMAKVLCCIAHCKLARTWIFHSARLMTQSRDLCIRHWQEAHAMMACVIYISKAPGFCMIFAFRIIGGPCMICM